jgi:SAM-dependent methyltransferase
MHEILDHLPVGARVLDLGSHEGSFSLEYYSNLATVRLDLARPAGAPGPFVQADAATLPFGPRTFDAVILNHILEHVVRLKPALQEVGRVVKKDGAVFVAVPDATTVSDRIYRRMYRNSGGHVNYFDSVSKLGDMLSWYFGLPHVATRQLQCSYNFLNRRNLQHPRLRGEVRFPGVPETLLAGLVGALRFLDRRYQTRFTAYGWALYFGTLREPVDPTVRINICIRCGQAHASEWLEELGVPQKKWNVLWWYRCPGCGAPNLYSR